MAEEGSLNGMRVLEIATMMAAPLAGMMLADHGAEVIKVELPGSGDGMRGWGYERDGHALMWKVLSRNKKLVTLDLHKKQGKELFLKLVAKSDVLIENFRPGTMARWGLGAEVLRKAKPDLIVLRVSGFGQTGPSSPRPGFGTLAEAIAGFAYINGWPDKPPSLPPFGLADSIAGITGAFGVLAALNYRNRTGEGQDVDVALYEPMLTVLGSLLIDYDQLGIIQERSGNVTPFAAPRNTYKTRDGKWFAMSASTQSTAERLFALIGRPEMITDPRFVDNRARLANLEAMDREIASWADQRSLNEAVAELEQSGVPACPVYTAADVLSDVHMEQRGSVICVDDEDLGKVRLQAPVPRLTVSPGAVRHLGGSMVGRDTAAVYADLLGLDRGDLEKLRAEQVV